MTKRAVTIRRSVKIGKRKQSSKQGRLASLLRGLGGLGGGAVGSLFGSPASGAAAGTSMGAALSKWLGAGDYTVAKNSIVQKASSSVPLMHSTDQTVTIRHREFVTSIVGTSAFTVAHSLTINPGLAASFPWLHQIAKSYQQYTIKGMVYHYIPTSGMAISGTNSALGSVMFQTSYRANDSAPTSKSGLLNEYWSGEVVPSESMCHPIECDPKENPFQIHYVRSGDIPSGDTLLYDIGKVHIATSGMQGTNIVGDVYCTYEIEFKKPQVSSNVTTLAGWYAAILSGAGGAASYFGAASSEQGNLDVSCSVKTITFPRLAGRYVISIQLNGTFTGATQTFSGAATLTNCAASTIDGSNSRVDFDGTGATANDLMAYAFAVLITDTSAVSTALLPTAVFSAGSISATTIQITYLGAE